MSHPVQFLYVAEFVQVSAFVLCQLNKWLRDLAGHARVVKCFRAVIVQAKFLRNIRHPSTCRPKQRPKGKHRRARIDKGYVSLSAHQVRLPTVPSAKSASVFPSRFGWLRAYAIPSNVLTFFHSQIFSSSQTTPVHRTCYSVASPVDKFL
jgi:hypothetical protein